MRLFNYPDWIDKHQLSYRKVEDIPQQIFESINTLLDEHRTDQPIASIVIPAFNEEINIVRTLFTLVNNVSQYSFEIIVINNNSTENTQQVLNRLNVRSYLQVKPGCGPARQLGQEMARGKFILMADADCFYPPGWIERMIVEMMTAGVSCVYGGYSFLTESGDRRLGLVFYEFMRGLLVWLRHFKRPYLNAMGMSMAYEKKLGLEIGFIQSNIRGEDGRMCFDLMQRGKVIRIKDSAYYVWTGTRTIDKEGGLFKAFINRLFFESVRLTQYFKPMRPHDTKTSLNRR